MNKHQKLFLFVLGFVLACSIVSLSNVVKAEVDNYGKFNKYERINLYQECDCSAVYITSISLEGKNATSLSFPLNMTKTNTHFNYTINSLNNEGIYTVTGYGIIQGVNTPWSSNLEITERENILYLDLEKPLNIIIIGCFLLLGLSLIFAKNYTLSGLILVSISFILINSGFNKIVSFIILVFGSMVMFTR